MRRTDWLLLAIGQRMEPIQVQKALFKFSRESGAPSDELYDFVPYNWGPCSFSIYDDIDDLIARGFIEAEPTGRGWKAYKLSERGLDRAASLREEADPQLVTRIEDIREWVVRRSFNQLLRDVYADYPESAVNSMFRDQDA